MALLTGRTQATRPPRQPVPRELHILGPASLLEGRRLHTRHAGYMQPQRLHALPAWTALCPPQEPGPPDRRKQRCQGGWKGLAPTQASADPWAAPAVSAPRCWLRLSSHHRDSSLPLFLAPPDHVSSSLGPNPACHQSPQWGHPWTALGLATHECLETCSQVIPQPHARLQQPAHHVPGAVPRQTRQPEPPSPSLQHLTPEEQEPPRDTHDSSSDSSSSSTKRTHTNCASREN